MCNVIVDVHVKEELLVNSEQNSQRDLSYRLFMCHVIVDVHVKEELLVNSEQNSRRDLC